MSSQKGNEEKSLRVSAIGWILLLACLLRVSAVIVRYDNLQLDRDAYLAIAQNLLDGNGYCSTVGQATAYRPPLYPLLVAACLMTGGFVALGTAQIILGTATVWLTWLLAHRCQLSHRTCLLAAIPVALDPLLIEYTTQPMTETLSTFLVTLLLVVTLQSGFEITRSGIVGGLFGLAALCRPSIWSFGVLAGTVWFIRKCRVGLTSGMETSVVSPQNFKVAFLCIAAVAITVSPWVIRNTVQFGRPILMTTHGGYTLHLANNDTFYDEVVVADSGATWATLSLVDWQDRNEQRLSGMGIARSDELSRDAALSGMAKDWIIGNPWKFVRSSILRLQRFWACRPSVQPGVPLWLISMASACYVGIFALAVISLGLCRRIWLEFWPLPVIVLAFVVVHSVYWSNARMRSAIVPVISLAAAAVFQRPSVDEATCDSDGLAD